MKRLLNFKGFTMVELMVVVAIIALLSAVAIPNFQKYQAKAKTSEAKLQLSALYLAESTFFTEYNQYGTCLDTMGFNPIKEESQRYYAVGFKDKGGTLNDDAVDDNGAPTPCKSAANACISTGNTSNCFAYAGGKSVGGATAPADVTSQGTASATANAFLGFAVGYISTDFTTGTGDSWSVDETKKITQTNVGY